MKDLATLARENMEEVVSVAREIMLDPLAKDSDRLHAVEFFADRGYGKAAQAIIALPLTKQAAQRLYGFTNSQLLEIIDEPRRLPAPVIDAEIVPARDPLLD